MYYSDKETGKSLLYLEKRIKKEYSKAMEEVSAQAEAYFRDFKRRYITQLNAYEAGEYTDKQFADWLISQAGRGKHWENLRDEMSRRLVEADKVANKYITDSTPSIMSLNYNFENYRISQAYEGISFDLWDETTVKRLIKNKTIELPTPRVDIDADLLWNRQKLQSSLISGILRGVSLNDIANEFQKVAIMDYNSAIRNARTSYTRAQNAGRQESYENAVKMGLSIKKEWIATLDERTRSSHQEMDGKVVDYDKEFPNGLMYPADIAGKPEEVWNCRCTIRVFFENIDQSRETYIEWKARMKNES